MLIDEWQHVPAIWDAVRRAVDRAIVRRPDTLRRCLAAFAAATATCTTFEKIRTAAASGDAPKHRLADPALSARLFDTFARETEDAEST